jgi:Uma2 family endonuclease
MSADEFCRLYPDRRAELVEGVVKELPMPGVEHGIICLLIGRLLGNFVEERSLGRVLCNDTWVLTRRSPDGVRGMDVAYISYARLPRGPAPRGRLEVPPELVVEVRSPSDTWTDTFAKVVEFLQAGVDVVAVIDPETRTVSLCRPRVMQEVLREGDTLALSDILPGFSIPVSRLFAE